MSQQLCSFGRGYPCGYTVTHRCSSGLGQSFDNFSTWPDLGIKSIASNVRSPATSPHPPPRTRNSISKTLPQPLSPTAPKTPAHSVTTTWPPASRRKEKGMHHEELYYPPIYLSKRACINQDQQITCNNQVMLGYCGLYS